MKGSNQVIKTRMRESGAENKSRIHDGMSRMRRKNKGMSRWRDIPDQFSWRIKDMRGKQS